MSNIVHRLDKIREKKGIEKKAFAKQLGVSRENLYTWTDENLKLANFLRACEILETSPVTFFSHGANFSHTAEPAERYGPSDCDQIRRERDFLKEQNEIHAASIRGLTASVEILTDKLRKTTEKVKK